jgi:hypothetical protein
MITNGTPGIVTPMTSRPAATRCISYQTDGNSTSRCGSLASRGRPVLVRAPDSTQLLLLPRLAIGCSHCRPVGHGEGGRFCTVFGVSVPDPGTPSPAGRVVESVAAPRMVGASADTVR